jgi:hypothetical protein
VHEAQDENLGLGGRKPTQDLRDAEHEVIRRILGLLRDAMNPPPAATEMSARLVSQDSPEPAPRTPFHLEEGIFFVERLHEFMLSLGGSSAVAVASLVSVAVAIASLVSVAVEPPVSVAIAATISGTLELGIEPVKALLESDEGVLKDVLCIIADDPSSFQEANSGFSEIEEAQQKSSARVFANHG